MRIHVLLPPRFEGNGKGEAILGSGSPEAAAWSRTEIPAPNTSPWTAMLEPGDAQ